MTSIPRWSTALGAIAAVVLVGCSPAIPTGPTNPRGVSRPAPRISRTRFLAFGDSITAGTMNATAATRMSVGLPQSYPARLQGLLTARYTEQTPVVANEGRPGERASAASARLSETIEASRSEAVIILHGANDIFADNVLGVPAAVSSVRTLVRVAKLAGPTVVLCTLLPQRAGGMRAANPAAVSELNRGIREIARDEEVLLIDLATAYDPTLIGADGLHPTDDGYARLAELFFAALREQFERPPRLH